MRFFYLFLLSISMFFQPIFSLENIEDLSKLPFLHPEISKSMKMQKLRLSNGMSVLVISDEKATQSAAALSLKVGSWSDPNDALGLAHFTEHMVFKSNAKFFDEKGFMQFVSDHNGAKNAYTSENSTVYTFEISTESFKDGLDRFSQFFIAPSFIQSEMARESHNVDEEFQRLRENDGWKFLLVQAQLSNPLHPFHRFTCGNQKTLGPVTHEMIKTWFESHYAPNLMSLVLYSSLPLETLKTYATEFFEKIPKRTVVSNNFPEKILSSKQEKHLITIQSTSQIPMLRMDWEFNQKETEDPTHSLQLIAYLINSSHPTSLTKMLKEKAWITDFGACVDRLSQEKSLFTLQCDLTEKGLLEKEKVLEFVYSYLNALKKQTIPKFLYSEWKQVQKRNYQYGERSGPYIFATNFAATLVYEDLATLPRSTLLPKHFDPKNCEFLLKTLTPNRTVVTLFLPKGKESKNFYNQKELWTQTPFKEENFNPQKLKLFATKTLKVNPLPKANPYFKEEIVLIDQEKSLPNPTPLLNTDLSKIYYSSAKETPSPQANFITRFLLKTKDAKTTALLTIFCRSFEDHFEEFISFATRAGASFSLKQDFLKNALCLNSSGFSYPATQILKEFLPAIEKNSLTKEKFKIFKATTLQELESAKKDLPLNQSKTLMTDLLNHAILDPEYEKALKDLTYEEIVDFSKNFFSHFAKIEGLFTGNISFDEAQKIAKEVSVNVFSSSKKPSEPKKELDFSLKNLSSPSTLFQKTEALGTGFILCIDEGNFSFEKLAMQSILDSVISEDFFDSIRSKQKLAYQAATLPLRIENELFHFFAIQSSAYHSPSLLQRTEQFLDHFGSHLAEIITKERFENIQHHLVQYYEKPYANLFDFSQNLFNGIFDLPVKEEFFVKKKILEALKTLKYDDFINTATSWLSSENKGRLAVITEGKIEVSKDPSYQSVTTDNLQKKLREP